VKAKEFNKEMSALIKEEEKYNKIIMINLSLCVIMLGGLALYILIDQLFIWEHGCRWGWWH